MRKLIPILIGLGLLFCTLWLQFTSIAIIKNWRTRFEYIAYDLELNNHLKKYDANNNDVALVLIDEKSLAAVGRWPWPRSELAELLQKLQQAGAVVVAFDMIFPEPEKNAITDVLQNLKTQTTDPNIIPILEKTAQNYNNDLIFQKELIQIDTTLGFAFNKNSLPNRGLLPEALAAIKTKPGFSVNLITAKSYTSNIAALQNSSKSAGFINVIPDSDGIIRRVPLVINYNNALYPSLALAAVKLYLLSDSKILWQDVGQQSIISAVVLGKQIIPVDDNGQVLIPYAKANSFAKYSATDVLQNKITGDKLAGKLVFVGLAATGLDLQPSAVQSPLPGVVIQASIASGILHNNFNYIPDWSMAAQTVILLVIGVLCLVLFPFLSAQLILLVAILLLISLYVGNNLLLSYQNIVLSMLFPGLIIILLALLNLSYGYFFEERKRKFLKSVFGQYVPEAYIEKLLAQPNVMQSETKEMTVLFSDIRNFTTISETMTADAIKAMLNQFFTPMTQIIFQHGGTIDKYVGDMIMAFWSAPLNDPEHAKHALAAAIAMQEKASELKSIFAAQGLPTIDIGIGINTGLMSVGDMGSEYRRAYTVIGDAVNVASRLESLTKNYQVKIIVSAETAKNQSDFSFKELDTIKVKGKNTAVTFFELQGYKNKTQG